jgi:hypothetical protein
MANLAQPGGENFYTLDGTDISELVSDCEISREGTVVEFEGSGGTDVAQWMTTLKKTGTLTVARDPTLMPALRTLINTSPRPSATLIVDDGTTTTYTISASNLTETSSSSDVNTADLEFLVLAEA